MTEASTAWKNFDDVAKDASDTIKRETRERFGIDVVAPGADTFAVALAQAERDRSNAAATQSTAAEEATAAQLLFDLADRREREAKEWAEKDWNNQEFDGADIADFNEFSDRDADWTQASEIVATPAVREVEPSGSPRSDESENSSQVYDSAKRRQEFANNLVSRRVNPNTIAARLLADGENAKHPHEAVSSATGKATNLGKKSSSAIQRRTRGGLSR